MHSARDRLAPPHTEDLAQYAHTVAGMHRALHRIFANKKAISESLLRTAAALRTISTASTGQRNTRRPPAC